MRALAVLVAAAVCGWAVAVVAPFWAVLLAAYAVVAGVMVWAIQRRVRYWGWRKPQEARSATGRPSGRLPRSLLRATARRADEPTRVLPAPPLAVESGLAAGQHDPAMREVMRGISAGLHDRYGERVHVITGARERTRL